jgi:hypothetical protein
MPTYTFQCPTCEVRIERFLRVSELDTSIPQCCGAAMQFVLQPVYGHVRMECRYVCPVTKEPITNWKQRRESFAKHGLSDAASDMTAQQIIGAANKRKADDAALASQMPHIKDHPPLEITRV